MKAKDQEPGTQSGEPAQWFSFSSLQPEGEPLEKSRVLFARPFLTRRFSQRPLLPLLLLLVKALLERLCVSFAGPFIKGEILQHKMLLGHHNLR